MLSRCIAAVATIVASASAAWDVLIEGRVHAAGTGREVMRHPGRATVAEVPGYTLVIDIEDLIAVPPGGVTLGPGSRELSMLVEDVRELLDYRDITGSIGGVRVHIGAGDRSGSPARGSHGRSRGSRVPAGVTDGELEFAQFRRGDETLHVPSTCAVVTLDHVAQLARR